jgi:hypothetical protein
MAALERDALRMVEEQILENYDIKDSYDTIKDIWQYRIVDKVTGEEKAQIQLTISAESTVAKYKAKYKSINHWFKSSQTKTVRAIYVLWLTSHQKGLGSKMLAYGVLMMKSKEPKIKYSVLDDVSNQSTSITKNIYSRFGYSPVEAVKKPAENEDPNIVEIQGPEKQVLLTDFVKHVEEMFSREPSRPQSKSRSSRKAESKPSNSSRKTRAKLT